MQLGAPSARTQFEELGQGIPTEDTTELEYYTVVFIGWRTYGIVACHWSMLSSSWALHRINGIPAMSSSSFCKVLLFECSFVAVLSARLIPWPYYWCLLYKKWLGPSTRLPRNFIKQLRLTTLLLLSRLYRWPLSYCITCEPNEGKKFCVCVHEFISHWKGSNPDCNLDEWHLFQIRLSSSPS